MQGKQQINKNDIKFHTFGNFFPKILKKKITHPNKKRNCLQYKKCLQIELFEILL